MSWNLNTRVFDVLFDLRMIWSSSHVTKIWCKVNILFFIIKNDIVNFFWFLFFNWNNFYFSGWFSTCFLRFSIRLLFFSLIHRWCRFFARGSFHFACFSSRRCRRFLVWLILRLWIRILFIKSLAILLKKSFDINIVSHISFYWNSTRWVCSLSLSCHISSLPLRWSQRHKPWRSRLSVRSCCPGHILSSIKISLIGFWLRFMPCLILLFDSCKSWNIRFLEKISNLVNFAPAKHKTAHAAHSLWLLLELWRLALELKLLGSGNRSINFLILLHSA